MESIQIDRSTEQKEHTIVLITQSQPIPIPYFPKYHYVYPIENIHVNDDKLSYQSIRQSPRLSSSLSSSIK
jgi:hypothetical protein